VDKTAVEQRVKFHDSSEIMEVDFSDLIFNDSADVILVYGTVEQMVQQTQKKWFFMVNYKNTKIFPDAWFQYARSGNLLNSEYSLGTVRINPDEPAKEAMKNRAQQDENFNPNLVSSREEALERVAELKSEMKIS